jgi:hypothetical protein
VNHRFIRTTTTEAFDDVVQKLRSGSLDHDIPTHGTLVRVRRQGGLRVSRDEITSQRASAAAERAEREARKESS